MRGTTLIYALTLNADIRPIILLFHTGSFKVRSLVQFADFFHPTNLA